MVGGWEFVVPLRGGNALAGWERIGGAGEARYDRETFLGSDLARQGGNRLRNATAGLG